MVALRSKTSDKVLRGKRITIQKSKIQLYHELLTEISNFTPRRRAIKYNNMKSQLFS